MFLPFIATPLLPLHLAPAIPNSNCFMFQCMAPLGDPSLSEKLSGKTNACAELFELQELEEGLEELLAEGRIKEKLGDEELETFSDGVLCGLEGFNDCRHAMKF